jgi:hypothetical protein
MTRPAGSSLDSGFRCVAKGYEVHAQWSPNAHEPVGNYCANTYRNNFGTLIGHTRVNVHT